MIPKKKSADSIGYFEAIYQFIMEVLNNWFIEVFIHFILLIPQQ